MEASLLSLFTLVLLVGGGVLTAGQTGPSFDQNYYITFGNDHIRSIRQGRELRLAMDRSTGSGIASKLTYSSGFFQMELKLPAGNSAGVVTAFYLRSQSNNAHDELDFEFLGNLPGLPYTLQTNVFTSGVGNREQRIQLWFDPTAAYHTYRILWNPHQVVFFVDNIPIRVYMNKVNIGVGYPYQPMQILTSLWDGESWATDGGRIKTDWSQAPFRAYLRSFEINGCPSKNSNTDDQQCYTSKYWWNEKQYWKLNHAQQIEYEAIKKYHMTYDYCSDRSRTPKPPPECPQ
ncbi:xyloglucan endotransglucosylase/hydrolase protein 2-like [Macadamia integrifolia]|uniref:xyloglucan endotransglucosylase/hydrolase protein 2-like n=1 Tax=Macadamia integrifolia TaxID=60698 RepID=UPI001C4FF027|nr:xyloglucan endotransglucosylase/hydrolase protein 2-like [Macadamia integrifolia]